VRAILLLVLAGCAAQAPLAPSENLRMREALIRIEPKEANLYSLADVSDTGTPGSRLARFERAAAAGAGNVTRTRVVFCVSGEQAWQCAGPWPGARVALNGETYSALAPEDVDDATLVSLFGYVGSPCFAAQSKQAELAADMASIRSITHESNRYEVQLAGRKGLHLVSLEPARGDCPFELRSVSALTKTEP
jgi:hypothetical protein